jgi:hypothetical protein
MPGAFLALVSDSLADLVGYCLDLKLRITRADNKVIRYAAHLVHIHDRNVMRFLIEHCIDGKRRQDVRRTVCYILSRFSCGCNLLFE